MVQARKKRLPAHERRALILDSAGRLFGEHGFDGVTLDEVAAAADVTKPVLYRHFDSKRSLYLAILERHRQDLPSFFERVPADLSGDQRLEAILEIWFAYVEERGFAWKMLFRDTGGGEEVQAFRRATQRLAREVLAAFVRDQVGRGVPEHEVGPLAEFLRAGGAGVALWSLEHPEVPRPALVAGAKRILSALATPA